MGPQGNRPQPRWWLACLCDVQENASVVYRRILLPGKDREGSSLSWPFLFWVEGRPSIHSDFLSKVPLCSSNFSLTPLLPASALDIQVFPATLFFFFN